MPFDLREALPFLLPKAVEWAEARAQEAAIKGRALDANATAIARATGVLHPELIRIFVVESLPVPDDPDLLSLHRKPTGIR